jgi:hypothetical protein
LKDADPVFLGEAVEHLHSALQHAVPGIVGGILEIEVAIAGPLVEQGFGGVLTQEEGGQCLFKGAPEQHGGARISILSSHPDTDSGSGGDRRGID